MRSTRAFVAARCYACERTGDRVAKSEAAAGSLAGLPDQDVPPQLRHPCAGGCAWCDEHGASAARRAPFDEAGEARRATMPPCCVARRFVAASAATGPTKCSIGALGLLGDRHLLVPQRLDVVGIGRARAGCPSSSACRPAVRAPAACARPAPDAPRDSRPPWPADARPEPPSCVRSRPRRSDGRGGLGCAGRRRARDPAPWPLPRPPRPAGRARAPGRSC